MLCDQEVFVYIYDKEKQHVIHYQSDPDVDLKTLFDLQLKREFLSNENYLKVGGER